MTQITDWRKFSMLTFIVLLFLDYCSILFSIFVFSQFIVSHLLIDVPCEVYVQMVGKPENSQ